MTGEAGFNFTFRQGKDSGSTEEGPMVDSQGSKEGHFAFLAAAAGELGHQAGQDTAQLETGMIHGENHMIGTAYQHR